MLICCELPEDLNNTDKYKEVSDLKNVDPLQIFGKYKPSAPNKAGALAIITTPNVQIKVSGNVGQDKDKEDETQNNYKYNIYLKHYIEDQFPINWISINYGSKKKIIETSLLNGFVLTYKQKTENMSKPQLRFKVLISHLLLQILPLSNFQLFKHLSINSSIRINNVTFDKDLFEKYYSKTSLYCDVTFKNKSLELSFLIGFALNNQDIIHGKLKMSLFNEFIVIAIKISDLKDLLELLKEIFNYYIKRKDKLNMNTNTFSHKIQFNPNILELLKGKLTSKSIHEDYERPSMRHGGMN